MIERVIRFNDLRRPDLIFFLSFFFFSPLFEKYDEGKGKFSSPLVLGYIIE